MEIQHPSHDHPLVLYDDDDGGGGVDSLAELMDGGRCKCCGHLGAGPFYACKDCGFYYHKSCFELAPQIESHPFHPQHPLRLDGEWGNGCQCCYHFCYFAYKCDECNYRVDPQCVLLNPILKLRDPKHHFFLLDKVDFTLELQCDACLVDFGGPRSQSPALVCAVPRCDYTLHLECSSLPFPETVRHSKYHYYHDLVYAKSALDGGFSDGYYCDACEEPREPQLPAYVCKEKECSYTAHVYCALSEVLPSLVERYENDLRERGASLDAILNYFQAEVSRLRERKEKEEAELEEKRQEIKAVEDELSQYEASS